VHTSALSQTWQRRLGRARRGVRHAGMIALAVCAVLGLAAAVKVFAVTAHPTEGDVAAIAHRIGNQRAAAGQFGADCVAAFLTTPATKSAALQHCLTTATPSTVASTSRAAATSPWVINTPQVWSVIPQGSRNDADLYAVTVMVQQRAYASAEPVRAFYRLPVSIWHYQPRAMDWPTPTSDPGPGADVKLHYDHSLSPSSRVYAVVAGFITSYLTSTTGLDRYVLADSWITPVGGYHSAVIQNADGDRDVGGTPAAGEQLHVRAVVIAQTSQFATITFSFPLTLESSAGTWMVADLDFIPQLNASADAVPIGPHN
jgi:hypothetical protein